MRYYPRLRDLREDADLTQDELIKLLHMHKTTYTNYEQGKREPPFELIIRLAELYNVSSRGLFRIRSPRSDNAKK